MDAKKNTLVQRIKNTICGAFNSKKRQIHKQKKEIAGARNDHENTS